jgi:hypothetical protein
MWPKINKNEHMKYTLYLLLCFVFLQTANAQTKFSIQPEIGFGFMFHRYTYDSIAPPARYGDLHAYSSAYANVLGVVTTKNDKWRFLAGVGMMKSSLKIQKVSSAEGLIDLLLFLSLFDDGYPDRYPYSTVKIKTNTLTVPFGIDYNISKKTKGKNKFMAGFRASLNYPVRKDVTITFIDSTLTSTDKEIAKTKFASLIKPTVSVMPVISFSGRFFKILEADYTVIPVILYTKSQYERIFTAQTGGAIQFSIRYTF